MVRAKWTLGSRNLSGVAARPSSVNRHQSVHPFSKALASSAIGCTAAFVSEQPFPAPFWGSYTPLLWPIGSLLFAEACLRAGGTSRPACNGERRRRRIAENTMLSAYHGHSGVCSLVRGTMRRSRPEVRANSRQPFCSSTGRSPHREFWVFLYYLLGTLTITKVGG